MNESAFPLDIDGDAAIVTLDRPTCLDIAGKHDLTSMMKELSRRRGLRAVIIAQDHPAAFLVNVAELADMTPQEARAFSASGHALAAVLEASPCPIICAVEGAALGGGCELVLACDLAFAGAAATLGQIEAMGGVMPAFGGSWRLARRVGYQRALEMMFTGAIIDAATAKHRGLVLDDVPEGAALRAARAFVERLTPTSAASVAAIKAAAIFGWNRDPAEIDRFEEGRFATLFGEEQSRRMHAFLTQHVKGDRS